MKGAQLGFTEWAINRSIHAIDYLMHSVLYILPASNPDAKDFSMTRFNAALELSEYLGGLFTDTKNVGLKRCGSRSLYIRGSKSKAQLKSIPVEGIVLDELEEMDEENIALVSYRQSGRLDKWQLTLSTPRVQGRGIHARFVRTDEKYFYFPCPSCSRWIQLTWPDSFVITGDSIDDPKLADSHYICTKCKNRLEHRMKPTWLAPGRWVPNFKDRVLSGYAINQLYSCTVTPLELARTALLARFDDVVDQEFHNSALGLPKTPKDGKLSNDHLNAMLRNYSSGQATSAANLLTMGIDVGAAELHYEIDEWLQPATAFTQEMARGKVIIEGSVTNWDDLHRVVAHYNPNKMVIDANPERTKSLEFCFKYPGIAYACYYTDHKQGKVITKPKDDEDANYSHPVVSVDRTTFIDMALGRFRKGTLFLPGDVSKTYREHLCNLVRVPTRDKKTGNTVYRYQKLGADHLGHARTYSEIALRMVYGVGETLAA